MAALAAVYNGQTSGDWSINLFYNNSIGQLAFLLKSGTEVADPGFSAWDSGDNDYQGYILNPSTMAAGTFSGVNFIVAVTKPSSKSETQTANQISIVSPVYQKLDTTSLGNNTVTVCTGGTECWVYYLHNASNSTVSLKQYELVTGDISTVLEDGVMSANSQLASWWVSDTERYVIFQDKETLLLKEFNVATGKSVDIEATKDAKEGTTLAVSFVNRVFLYYTDKQSNLRRVLKENDSWGESKDIADIPKVGSSQITAVAANNYNHLFYMAQQNTKDEFTHVKDLLYG
ncbi:uncharacterized protein K452DRAFT_356217 [Aplosporella prunicola CBS 121167]|uniref:Fucose-specific lectin n=1 Tax=Aplosporella prunicola CBS 121167 TaxID=1176127 RepID=A0A6A6BL41_9PEZI|nr:uncharacterized protein K452DRAFT_356217 [Aplosporella prunicola CBS 121167]KAF2144840.1 hypothetical protein K452DRAFT_356217 [Aplosporella prunicola CBS 121167]